MEQFDIQMVIHGFASRVWVQRNFDTWDIARAPRMEPQHLSFDDPESSGEQERGRPLNCDDLKNRFRNPSVSSFGIMKDVYY